MADIIERTDGKKISFSGVANEKQTLKEVIDDLYFKPGDTLTISGVLLDGVISSALTSLISKLIAPKNLKNIKEVTITSLKAEARTGKGYLNSQSGYQNFLASGYKPYAAIRTNYELGIVINKTSAYTNVDNNTLVSLRVQELTLKFE